MSDAKGHIGSDFYEDLDLVDSSGNLIEMIFSIDEQSAQAARAMVKSVRWDGEHQIYFTSHPYGKPENYLSTENPTTGKWSLRNLTEEAEEAASQSQ